MLFACAWSAASPASQRWARSRSPSGPRFPPSSGARSGGSRSASKRSSVARRAAGGRARAAGPRTRMPAIPFRIPARRRLAMPARVRCRPVARSRRRFRATRTPIVPSTDAPTASMVSTEARPSAPHHLASIRRRRWRRSTRRASKPRVPRRDSQRWLPLHARGRRPNPGAGSLRHVLPLPWADGPEWKAA
jgi:hypothetical protein